MSRTKRTDLKGKFLKTPKTTNAKRALTFKDNELLQYGIKLKSMNSFANAWDDRTISAVYEQIINRKEYQV